MIRGSIVASVLPLPLQPPSSLLLLSLSLSLSLTSAGSIALRRPVEIRAAVILPAESKFITTLSKVMPVLDIAVRDLYAKGILRETDFTFRFMQRDDKCEDIEAIRSGFELIFNGRVDLFLGPTCDYGVDVGPALDGLQFISNCRAPPEVLIAIMATSESTALAEIKRHLIIILLVSAEQQRVISMAKTLYYGERFRYRQLL
ncbi:hypothetical protein QTP88_016562 [Uroleucon formosanum]